MDKQVEIQKYLAGVNHATIEQIYANVPFGYYHNAHKYIGEILARMIKSGKVERVSRGKYRYLRTNRFIQNNNELRNQLKLW